MATQVWLRRMVCLLAAVVLFLMDVEAPFQNAPPPLAGENESGERTFKKEFSGKGSIPAPNRELVPVRVQRIVLINDMPAVLLMDHGGTRFLLMFIDFFMAKAIRSGMIGAQPKRPLTHDLIGVLLNRLGGKVKKITITELKDNTYFSLISLQVKGRVEEIDARPSDALAIAVRSGAPIYAEASLLKPLPGKGENPREIPPPVRKHPETPKRSI